MRKNETLIIMIIIIFIRNRSFAATTRDGF